MGTSPKTITKTIRVTKTGIKRGDKGIQDSCPIARAVKATGFRYVYVDKNGISATTKSQKSEYTVPYYTWIKRFISKFDADKKVNPFTRKVRFTLKNG